MSVQETRMMAKAIEQRWPMSADVRRAVVGRLLRVMMSQTASPREITSAAKAIIAAEAQNQKDEHAKIDEFNERILGIAQRCGIDVNLLGLGVAADRGPEARDAAAAITAVD